MKRLLVSLVAAALLAGFTAGVVPITPVLALDNGSARTPPMGFNDWNAFGCNVSEQLIKQTADLFVSSGLKDAGYEYVNIDDCWMTHARDPQTGRLVPDPVKFPDGIKGTADYVHSKGLKLGIYEDAGTQTCAGYPGSLGHEQVDAQTFADWGVDYLKYDNCNNAGSATQQAYIDRYTAMRDALAATGRDIVYSLCEWGLFAPWTWADKVGNLWRTTGDISDNWSSLLSIIKQNAPLAAYAKPGAWNDPDMLEVGNGGMTDTEYRTHFSLWAEMAAPLLIGTDLRKATPETMAIYLNKDVIAVDQDPLGKQGVEIANANGHDVFAKPLANGDVSMALFNETSTPSTISTTAAAIGLPKSPAYTLKDLWTHTTTEAAGTFTETVPAHGVVMYRVAPTTEPGAYPPNVGFGMTGVPAILPAGQGVIVSESFTNNARVAVSPVTLTLIVPSGWTATPTTATTFPAVPHGKTVTASWLVTATPQIPMAAELTGTASYAWDTGSAQATSTADVHVTSPIQPPYLTFASTSAYFGQAGSQFGIYGDGGDVWVSTNQYGAIYLHGAEQNGTVAEVKVTAQQPTDPWAKAGIMIRNDITNSSRSPGFLIVAVTPGNGYVVQWDSNGDGRLDNSAPSSTGPMATYPSWLKVVRSGTSYTGYYSTDGTNWILIATVNVPNAAATQDVGMFMTSHASGSLGEADFANFSVQ